MANRRKPGRTEITIDNLTPLADEHSIKVEGHGTRAVVTDMTVDLVPNRMMGKDSDDDDDDDSADGGDGEDSEDEDALAPDALKAANNVVRLLQDRIDELSNSLACAEERLCFLKKNRQFRAEHHAVTPDLDEFKNISAALYREMKGLRDELEKVHGEKRKACKKQARLQSAFDRQRKGPRREKEIKQALERDRRDERRKQRLQLPNRAHRVKITVENEVLPAETKTTTGTAEMGRPRKPEDDEIPARELPYLRISYITGGASWTPRYDLRLDSTKRQGTLTYRAHYSNMTGETWKDAKITLSTSQNTFSGLEDKAPWMAAWNVTLQHTSPKGVRYDRGLLSPAEVGSRQLPYSPLGWAPAPAPPAPPAPAFYSTQRSARSRHSSSAAAYDAATPWRLGQESGSREISSYASTTEEEERGYGPDYGRYQRPQEKWSPPPPPPGGGPSSSFPTAELAKLQLAMSSAESHGMTTTYDLPGVRTITSSKLVRQHIITEVALAAVQFSHLSVPKLRASVFFKARVTNPKAGGVSLLHGKAGLTLDGSFMGNTTIPLCVPGDHFDVGLGVDESIQVHYSKPSERASSQGMLLMKENVVSYCRSIRIHNARQGPVRLLVLDQVPVSDDERLRIALLQPKGLRSEGDEVPVVPGKSKLGTVKLRKHGELLWELAMDGGGDLELPIDYEARMPQGSSMVAK